MYKIFSNRLRLPSFALTCALFLLSLGGAASAEQDGSDSEQNQTRELDENIIKSLENVPDQLKDPMKRALKNPPAPATPEHMLPNRAYELSLEAIDAMKGSPEQKRDYLAKLALHLGKNQEFESAKYVAARIADHKRNLTMARLAAMAAEAGQSEMAEDLVAESQKRSMVTGTDVPERIKEAQGLALARIGKLDELRELIAGLNEGSIYQMRLKSALKAAELKPGEVPKPGQERPTYPEDWLRVAQTNAQGEMEQMADLYYEEALNSVPSGDPIDISRIYLEAVREYAQLPEQQEKAVKALNEAVKSANTIPATYDVKSELLGDLAVAAKDKLNDPEQALVILDSVEASARGVRYARRGPKLAEAALVAWRIGEKDRALQWWKEALEIGEENPNPRVRAKTLADVYMGLGAAGLEPDGDLKTVAKELQQSL